MPLNDLSVRNAKPRDRDYKLSDGGGLYLLVQTNGSRLWRQKYRFNNKELVLAHGAYPRVSVATARGLRDAAKEILSQGRDPGAEKKQSKKAVGDTFEAWGRAWFANRKSGWVGAHADRVLSRLEKDAFKAFGATAIRDVTRVDVLAMLRRIEDRGSITVAKRVKGYCSDIFEYAISESGADRNPVTEIGRRVLKPNPRTVNFTKLPLDDLPAFLASVASFGSERTRLAILTVVLTWVRTSEIRFASADEFEFGAPFPIWRIPKERMKMEREHLVPLSPRATEVVRRLIDLAGGTGPLFGAAGMSNTTMLQALYSLGWGGRATIHGLRGVASTWANDSLTLTGDRKYHEDWVETQLAHDEEDAVRGAYNAAQYLAPRKRMMDDWGAFIVANEAIGELIG